MQNRSFHLANYENSVFILISGEIDFSLRYFFLHLERNNFDQIFWNIGGSGDHNIEFEGSLQWEYGVMIKEIMGIHISNISIRAHHLGCRPSQQKNPASLRFVFLAIVAVQMYF